MGKFIEESALKFFIIHPSRNSHDDVVRQYLCEVEPKRVTKLPCFQYDGVLKNPKVWCSQKKVQKVWCKYSDF